MFNLRIIKSFISILSEYILIINQPLKLYHPLPQRPKFPKRIDIFDEINHIINGIILPDFQKGGGELVQ